MPIATQTATAKIFWTGNSQAIRLPKAFRFDGNEVTIKKQGNKVILEPIVDDWAWLEKFENRTEADVDPTFEQAILDLKEEMRTTPAQQRDFGGLFE